MNCVAAGRPMVVYPLVEESEKTDLQAAMQGAAQLQADELAGFRVGLVHGRMKSEEKEHVMASYKKGEIQVLVSTTVVEVGVDVSNATVMMIEHAERFGLAQLHQLRGRVGRSGYQSYCLLMASGGVLSRSTKPKPAGEPASAARERLDALVRSTDGFVIAEEDLRIRGPGEFFGFRQWGMPEFRVANLVRDADMLQQARQEAFALLKQDPQLKAPVHRALRETMLRRWEAKLDLGSVSWVSVGDVRVDHVPAGEIYVPTDAPFRIVRAGYGKPSACWNFDWALAGTKESAPLDAQKASRSGRCVWRSGRTLVQSRAERHGPRVDSLSIRV